MHYLGWSRCLQTVCVCDNTVHRLSGSLDVVNAAGNNILGVVNSWWKSDGRWQWLVGRSTLFAHLSSLLVAHRHRCRLIILTKLMDFRCVLLGEGDEGRLKMIGLIVDLLQVLLGGHRAEKTEGGGDWECALDSRCIQPRSYQDNMME